MVPAAPRMLASALLAGALLAAAPDARAQCGTASSCRQCHEVEGRAPPERTQPWHTDHAFADLCVGCHGGNGAATDESTAHAGLSGPLSGDGVACATCHAGKPELARAYVAHRESDARKSALTPPPHETPGSPLPPTRPPGPGSPSAGGSPVANRVLSLAIGLVAVLGGALVSRDLRRPRAVVKPPAGPPFLRRREWSPVVAGALLGVLVALSMALLGHRLSGGGAYLQIAAFLGRRVAPHAVFFTHVVPAAWQWEILGAAGAALGAFAAAWSSGGFRVRTMPDSGWTERFGASVPKRWLIGFVGAALTEIAAGIAGGCTASLAVSGGAALAPGAFAFMAGMFAGGVPTAWLTRPRGPRGPGRGAP